MLRIPSFAHGVARTRNLVDAGLSRRQIARLVQSGDLVRLQRGWYATEAADPDVVRAIRRGGRVSCLSALGRLGLWLPPHAGLHIRLLEHALTQPAPAVTGVHCCRAPGPQGLLDLGPVDPLPIALAAAGRCTTAEYFVAILDSVLRLGQHRVDDVAFMLRHSPRRVQELVSRTAVADSGTESLVRFRLESLQIRVEPQVRITGVGWVDFLVGRSLVLEVDSRAHHTDPDAYRRDRARDLALARLGYRCLRLTYHDVLDRWDEALAGIMTIIRRGDHLRPPLPHH